MSKGSKKKLRKGSDDQTQMSTEGTEFKPMLNPSDILDPKAGV